MKYYNLTELLDLKDCLKSNCNDHNWNHYYTSRFIIYNENKQKEIKTLGRSSNMKKLSMHQVFVAVASLIPAQTAPAPFTLAAKLVREHTNFQTYVPTPPEILFQEEQAVNSHFRGRFPTASP